MNLPWTILYFTLWVNMQKWAFLIMTCIESSVEITFWHFRHVIFMEEFTLVPLLAEATKPMLADHCPVPSYMSVRTLGPIIAASWLTKEFTYCCC